jgi:hypothetical protein
MTEQYLYCERHDENKNTRFFEGKTGIALALQGSPSGITAERSEVVIPLSPQSQITPAASCGIFIFGTFQT